MKIGQNFNKLTLKEYEYYIENHKKYTDFNTLGLYRSLTETTKLSIEEKIKVRDLANKTFGKTYEFLQLKDPYTYFKLITLGQENMTGADERKVWDDIIKNQELILKDKKIKHRNFGIYSKHICGNEHCHWNGLMVKQNTAVCENTMGFISDKSKSGIKNKAIKFKKEQRLLNKVVQYDSI